MAPQLHRRAAPSVGPSVLAAEGSSRPQFPVAAHPEDEIENEEQVFDAFGAALHPHGGARPAELGLVLERAGWVRRTGSGIGRWPGALAGRGTGVSRARCGVEKGWRPNRKRESRYRSEAGARSLGPGARRAPHSL